MGMSKVRKKLVMHEEGSKFTKKPVMRGGGGWNRLLITLRVASDFYRVDSHSYLIEIQ